MKDKIKREIRRLYCTKEQSANEKYKNYLDMVKGIAIFLVVLGHSGTINHTVNTWLSTFHLPTFFVVSGILMNLKQEAQSSIKNIFKYKIRQILVPYICFSVCTVFFLLINIIAGKLQWQVLKQLIWQTFTLQGYSVMWFLTVLFFAELFVIILLKILERICRKDIYVSIILCIVTTVLGMISYHIYNNNIVTVVPTMITEEIRIFVKAFVAGAFISCGYFICDVFSWIDNKKNSSNRRILYRFVELLVGVILSFVNIIVLPYIQLMDLNNLNVGELYKYLLLGVGGSLGLILICRNIPNIPILSYYGQNSLIIMCTHLNCYVLYIALVLGQYIAAHIPGNYIKLWCISSMMCVMILEIPVIIFIKVFFPFMLGKKK